MQAFWFEQFGQAAAVLQQGEQPTPQPAAGEVLVRLHATGVNPSCKKAGGCVPQFTRRRARDSPQRWCWRD